MALDQNTINAIIDGVASHAAQTGLFLSVNEHEPKSPPNHQLSGAVWVMKIKPSPRDSGLAASSAVVIGCLRLYAPMGAQPYDQIERTVWGAVVTLLGQYTGDFTLGGLIRNIDLLGQSGVDMEAAGGYMEMTGQINRVVTITIPMIVNDAWAQA